MEAADIVSESVEIGVRRVLDEGDKDIAAVFKRLACNEQVNLLIELLRVLAKSYVDELMCYIKRRILDLGGV